MQQRMRWRYLFFFLVVGKARENAAKLRRWRGRQLSWPDARRRREAVGGVVPLLPGLSLSYLQAGMQIGEPPETV
jgi:hypothetical protein